MKKNFKLILSCLLLIILIIFFICKNNVNLEIYKNTNITDKKKIESIIKKLDLKEGYKNIEIEENKLIVNYEIDYFDYKTLEKNASFLFYLINDLSDIKFNIGEEKFNFSYEYINKIYEKINIKNIKKRYDSKYFSYLYLGNVNGKIDFFDKSENCLENYEKLYEDDNYSYYITCSSVDDVIVVIENEEFKLKDAVEDKVDINDLFNINIKIEKREKNENNS